MKDIKNNKFIKVISKGIKILIVLATIILIAFAIVQKTSDNRGSIAGIKVFTVVSGSMIPVYEIGDILIVKEIKPEEINVGDDIVYKGAVGSYRNKAVTHRVRVIEKREDGNYTIVTKGVANSAQDPAINQNQVLGKVIGKVPIISFILKLITNIYIWISIPAIILIRKNIKKMKSMEIQSE